MQSFLFDPTKAESSETLEDINSDLLLRSKALPQLASRVLILGEGRPGARVAFVGESPGPPDEKSGRPFMGPVGEMLSRMLSSIGLRREDCYLTNTVKIISAANEINPELLSFFMPFLYRELAAVSADVIITLGNTPAQALLRTKKPISQLRGEFYDFNGAKVMPTFNPAYLLRDPTKKREAWEDLKKVRDLLASS